MSDFTEKKSKLDARPPPDKIANNRIATRFIRKDIAVSLANYRLIHFHKLLPTKLIDISSKGVQVSCLLNIANNKSLRVFLEFKDGRNFALNAKTIWHKPVPDYRYNLNFTKVKPVLQTKEESLKQISLLMDGQKISAKFRKLTFRSVQIFVHQALKSKRNIAVLFEFDDGEKFTLAAEIDRCRKITHHYYGIKFDKLDNELGEYLLKTQTDLSFS